MSKEADKRWRARNRDKINAQRNEWRKSVKGMLCWVKSQAKAKGIVFDLKPDDISIPEFCPVLGIKLGWNGVANRDSSPSLDRFVPELGYVPGNVMVISFRANRLKNDGTAEELIKVAMWMSEEKERRELKDVFLDEEMERSQD